MARKTPWQQTLSHLVSEHRAPPGGRPSLSPKPRTLAGRAFPLLAIALVAALAVGVLVLWPGGSQPAGAQSAEPIMYDEGGEGPVATFIAQDPDEDDKPVWSLNGDDEDQFEIKEGVLTFKEVPDYEVPTDADTDNTYELTVTATDGGTGDAGTNKLKDTFDVVVEVANVDEPGKVTWTVDHHGDSTLDKLVQFQSGAVLEAVVTDGDVSGTDKDVSNQTVVGWRWYRSQDKAAKGTAIDGATYPIYTVTDDDVDHYLRVEAGYILSGPTTEKAQRVSDYPVLAAAAADATAPAFAQAAMSRKVKEGKKGIMVGDPVTATGGYGALNYALDGTDKGKFSIDPKTGQITTKVDLDFEAAAGADDNCGARNSCKVEVTATDAAGAPSDPAATVTITLENVDEKPYFTDGVTKKNVMEGNTEVSDTSYGATDPEGDLITLSLTGDDARLFEFKAGNILHFQAKPDFEKPKDKDQNNIYEVTVRAEDDGGMYTGRAVRVTVTDVDEGPIISGPESRNYPEGGTGPVATFTARNPEGATKIYWTLAQNATIEGVDTGDFEDGVTGSDNHFAIDDDGVLTFTDTPDFEDGSGGGSGGTSNTYKVVVLACDVALDTSGGIPTCPAAPDGQVGFKKVTVNVTAVKETGELKFEVGGTEREQFLGGEAVSVVLEDEDVAGATKTVAAAAVTRWEWRRLSTRGAAGTTISSGDGSDYATTYTVSETPATPATNDVGNYLKLTVTYTTGSAPNVVTETVTKTTKYKVLSATAPADTTPTFVPDEVDLSVKEGKASAKVGAPVTATKGHGTLTYTLAGDDSARFAIDPKTGQITTAVALNFEGDAVADTTTLGSCSGATAGAPDRECAVTITATDLVAGGAQTDTATVTITILNVDEAPTFSDTTGKTLWDVQENVKAVTTGNRFEATDEDGRAVSLSLKSGQDSKFFRLTSDKDLAFKVAPDYEDPQDRGRDNTYEVTVRASDGTKHADETVTVTVENVNEKPKIMKVGVSLEGPANPPDYAENGTDAVATYTPSEAEATLSLGGDDAGDFEISRAGMLSFMTSPDYENPMDDNMDNTYEVTVMATHMAYGQTYMAEQMVMVMVTNMDEAGMVALSPMSPSVGTMITAELTDPDGGVTGTTWQWSKSMTMDGDFMDIDEATMMAYTPVAADDGYYLMAEAMYTDGHGADKTAMAKTGSAVVTVEDQQGMVTLSTMEPIAGMAVAAELMDADTVVEGSVDWQWSRSMTMDGTFEHISAETASYTPTVADIGYYLKVTATYTDGHGSGKTAMATANMAVRDPVVARYDINPKNGMVEKAEVIAAINDYLGGEANAPTKAEVIRLINMYLGSGN